MLTVAYAERLQPYGVTVNVCHPGEVVSRLSNNLGFGGNLTPVEGAKTPVWLAVSRKGEQVTGKFFDRQREVQCKFAGDRKAIEELYAACLRFSDGLA